MDCREKILSNDYYDIMTDYPVALINLSNLDACDVSIGNLYSVVYLNRSEVSNTNEYFYDYKSVPKLYGLMQQTELPRGFDPNSMIVSGITQVQREPLELTGRGVVICLIDTGECVRIMPQVPYGPTVTGKSKKRCGIFGKSVIHLFSEGLLDYVRRI